MRSTLLGLAIIVCIAAGASGQSCSIQVFLASPDAGDAARAVLLQSLDGARETLAVALASLADDQLGDALVRAHRRGVAVRVILPAAAGQTGGGEYRKLVSAGVPVRLSDVGGAFDHRFAVIDRRIVLTGSYGWTAGGTAAAYGSLVRITCANVSQATAAAAYLTEFDRLWAAWAGSAGTAAQSASAVASVGILAVDRAAQCIYLLNTSEHTVDLGGWTLSDLEGYYTFPAGTEALPNDPYRVCIDEFNPTHDPSELYLDPTSDEIFLSDPEGDIVDELVW